MARTVVVAGLTGAWLLLGPAVAGRRSPVAGLPAPVADRSPVPGRPSPAVQCPAPRVSTWSSIRDTLWPLIVHRDGDEAWAHLQSAGFPRESATWCNPLERDVQALAAGRDLYREQCASCHGDEGRGDGPGAGVADPRPYDFTQPAFAGMRVPPGPAVLYATLARGIDGTAMAAFPTLSGWERLALMAYITSLPGTDAMNGAAGWADTLRARRPRD